MAFPTAGTPVAKGFSTSVTSMAVTMPATINSGDLLIALVEVRNAGTWTKPTGWSDISTVSQAGGGSVGKINGFYKIADGTEAGTTPTWIASTGTTAQWQVIRVTGWHGTTPPEGATASGDATNANPPSLTPSWGADDTLWIAVAANAASGTTNTFSAAPTNYSGFQNNGSSSGGSSVDVATATRQLNAVSEDPSTFSVNNNRFWAAVTIAIRPATASNTTTTQTETGTSRITVTTTKTQSATSRITATTVKTESGVSRITTTSLKTETGVSRITARTTKTQTGVANIRNTTINTENGITRITATTLKTESGISRISVSTTKTESGVARMTATTNKTLSGTSRITNSASNTQTGISRITITSTQTENGISRITQVRVQTESATARITAVTTQSETGISRIESGSITTTQSLSGTASILSTVSGLPDFIWVDGHLCMRLFDDYYTKL